MSKTTISASATGLPSKRQILEAYREWLHYEGRLLGKELFPGYEGYARLIPESTLTTPYHF